MAEQRDYASILNAVIEKAKEIWQSNPDSDVALACYQLIETAISEAEVWGVEIDRIGLSGFEPRDLLKSRKVA